MKRDQRQKAREIQRERSGNLQVICYENILKENQLVEVENWIWRGRIGREREKDREIEGQTETERYRVQFRIEDREKDSIEKKRKRERERERERESATGSKKKKCDIKDTEKESMKARNGYSVCVCRSDNR